jgi:hypothetical protein
LVSAFFFVGEAGFFLFGLGVGEGVGFGSLA